MGADLKALAREAGMLAVSRIVDLSPVTQIESTNSYGVSVRKKDFDLDVLHAQSSRGQIVGDASAQAPCEGEGSALLVSQTDSAVSVSEPVPVSREDTAPAGHAGDCQQTSTQSATDSSPMAVDISTNALDVTAAHPGHAEAGHNSPLTSKDVNADVAVTAVEMRDFTAAAKSVQPTAKREGFAVVPDVTWGERLR